MSVKSPSVLAIIPARGGSKGLPAKNLKMLQGKPLLTWTIEAAIGAHCISKVVVSTDDLDIASIAKASGAEVPFIRPGFLSTDNATTADVVSHASSFYKGFDFLIVLQPTSPLRNSLDIDNAFLAMTNVRVSSCVSVNETTESPWLMFQRNSVGSLSKIISDGRQRRQDFPPSFIVNGAIYIVSSRKFQKEKSFFLPDTFGYVMENNRSIDIDTLDDFMKAERLILASA